MQAQGRATGAGGLWQRNESHNYYYNTYRGTIPPAEAEKFCRLEMDIYHK